MERARGPQTPYEVYCDHCHVTFPRETRNCIHCGRRLGAPGRPAELTVSHGTATPGSHRADPTAEAEADFEEVEDAGSLLLRRFGGLAVWAVLALAAVLSNMCQGRG